MEPEKLNNWRQLYDSLSHEVWPYLNGMSECIEILSKDENGYLNERQQSQVSTLKHSYSELFVYWSWMDERVNEATSLKEEFTDQFLITTNTTIISVHSKWLLEGSLGELTDEHRQAIERVLEYIRLVIEKWRDFTSVVRPKPIRPDYSTPPALEPLLQSLRQTQPKFEDFYRRVALIKSIRELGHPKAIPDLEEIAKTDTQQYDAWGLDVAISVAEIAEEAIEHIEKRTKRRSSKSQN